MEIFKADNGKIEVFKDKFDNTIIKIEGKKHNRRLVSGKKVKDVTVRLTPAGFIKIDELSCTRHLYCVRCGRDR